MGFWGGLAKIGGIVGGGLATAFTGGAAAPLLGAALSMGGQVAGSLADSAAANRGTKLDASQEQDRINTLRGVEDRNSQGDAWKRLQQAQYILNKKAGYTPAMTGAGQVASFGTAPTGAPSEDMMTGARGLSADTLRRLTEGSQLPPTSDVNKLSKMSVWEKLMNIAGPTLSGLGAINSRGGGGGGRAGTPPFVAPRVGSGGQNPWTGVSF